MKLEQEHLHKINSILARKINAEESNPCFCGSGKLFTDCCRKQPNFWVDDTYLDKVIAYAKYNAFSGGKIPTVFLNDFYTKFFKRFGVCANPQCNNKAIGSHVFGESLIRKYFGRGKCQWYVVDDHNNKNLVSAGVSSDLKYPIFCQTCDNKLFKEIDKPDHDVTDVKNILKHIVRCMAFQYQFTRTSLSLAHQLTYGSIKIIFARQEYTGVFKKNEQINLDYVIRAYIYFKFHNEKMDQLWSMYEADNLDQNLLKIHSRFLSAKEVIFAQGIKSPIINLDGSRREPPDPSGVFFMVMPKDEQNVYVTFATLDENYYDYIDQLQYANDYKVKSVVNQMTQYKDTPYGLLLSNAHQNHQKALR
jgi:hypothetical protein